MPRAFSSLATVVVTPEATLQTRCVRTVTEALGVRGVQRIYIAPGAWSVTTPEVFPLLVSTVLVGASASQTQLGDQTVVATTIMTLGAGAELHHLTVAGGRTGSLGDTITISNDDSVPPDRYVIADCVIGRHVRRPGGDRACAVAGRPTLRGWPLAAKSP